ncbi:MAG TPA: hypothetical protein VLA61_23030 [Ideonella sp.]|uniref:hypothetical protein n=1 Tax=Ideonella sp. TaxID=1929293 RepID=UPI002BA5796F|nr:hypothetical protein [Ideonella sp.]HSI51148.1 hypothetical protein [Ideonella sp.]
MKRAWKSAALAVAAGLACGHVAALESMATYDNFGASPIDASKWSSYERTRRIKNGALQLAQRDWGLATSDAGTQANSYSEQLSNPAKVTQFKAVVTLNAIELTGCSANPGVGAVRARVAGSFFNTGNPTSGDYTGDVLAQVRVIRYSDSVDAAGLAHVEAVASVCRDSDCSSTTTIGGVQQLGTLAVGESATLAVEWDKATKTFNFWRDITVSSVSYTLNDSIAPAVNQKYVGLRTEVPNCLSGARASGFVDASFDNVQINKSAKP